MGEEMGNSVYLCVFGGSPLSHAALRHDSSPAGGAKCTCVNRSKVCGKAKPKKLRLTTKFASVHGRALGSPSGRAGAERLRGEKKKSARLCGRFEMFALYRMFVLIFLRARKGRQALHSLRRATTGSFLAALREGIRPEIKVSRTLMPTRITAAGRGSTA